jgi:hypothetical protein
MNLRLAACPRPALDEEVGVKWLPTEPMRERKQSGHSRSLAEAGRPQAQVTPEGFPASQELERGQSSPAGNWPMSEVKTTRSV